MKSNATRGKIMQKYGRSNEDSAGPVHSMFDNPPKLTDEEITNLYKKLKI